MIRGIEAIVRPEDLRVGEFYLDPGYGAGTTLFQWVRIVERGTDAELALVFSSENRPALALQELALNGPLIKMPPVDVRVDPPSATGTSLTKSYMAGSFLLESDKAIIMAKTSHYGYTAIDILQGVGSRPGNYWIEFARWSLVVDEAGEEIPIASFGEEAVAI